MYEVQKNTYIDLVTSNIYSEDSFVAKSITLDFLYSFETPCLAIIELTSVIKKPTMIGLKCIQGIVMAVDEFSKSLPMVVNIKFVDALIGVLSCRIGDTSLPEYLTGMEQIITFITNNMYLKLINNYFSLIMVFKYCDLNNEENAKVFHIYCNSLMEASERLKKMNSGAFEYYLKKIKAQYAEEMGKIDERLKEFFSLFETSNNNVLIYSNEPSATINLFAKLKERCKHKLFVVKDNIEELVENSESECIVIIDFAKESYQWILYYLGMMQGNSLRKGVHVQFLNRELISKTPQLVVIVDKYNQDDGKLLKILS